MRTYNATIKNIDCIVEINGGDESDHDQAEALIFDHDEKSPEQVVKIVHETITANWHDSNGFDISITPVA